MDNIAAIEILEYMKNAYGKKPRQALDLAIKALKLSESINEVSSCIGTRLYETDRQITIEEYMQSMKGENQ